MRRSKEIITAVLAFALSISVNAIGYTADEATATDVQKKVMLPCKCNSVIPQISAAKDEEALDKLITDAFSESCAFENYEKFVADARVALQDPAFNNKDYLNYAIAKARFDQLSALSKDNEIEAGRLYMSVNDKYFTEAVECLDKAAGETKSKSLLIDNNLLKFIIFKERLQPQKADATFDAVALQIAKYSEDPQANKRELGKVSGKLKKMGLERQAIKLKIIYASKVDPKTARETLEEIKTAADGYFSQNGMKDAAILYEQYIASAPAYYNKEDVAAKVMEIGEKYYAAGKYRDAKKYYEFYMDKYGDLPPADFGSYKLAMCYYSMKDHVRSISQLEAFLEKYKNSAWFDKAFEMLAKVYYENLPRDKAIENLQSLMDRHYRKGAGDYAQILMAMLYYRVKNYDTAEDRLKKIEPTSMYAYTAKMLLDDIKEIRDNKIAPTFGSDSTETYKVWDPYQPVEVKVAAAPASDKDKAIVMTTAEDGTITLEAPRGARIQFTLQGMVDEDRFNEYMADKEDPSRLPKMIREETEKDLISLHWASESGKFADDKETDVKIWQAPDEPGSYKMTVKVDDFGLVRVPNKGVRKDKMRDVNLVVVVK